MSVQVRIPTPLRKLTGNKGAIEASGDTIEEIFETLEKQFPGMKEKLYNEDGSLKRFVNIYINKKDIRSMEGEKTVVKDGDEIAIIPAIAGGKR
jgi:molybdopterin synthase sulfur carrier subunit